MIIYSHRRSPGFGRTYGARARPSRLRLPVRAAARFTILVPAYTYRNLQQVAQIPGMSGAPEIVGQMARGLGDAGRSRRQLGKACARMIRSTRSRSARPGVRAVVSVVRAAYMLPQRDARSRAGGPGCARRRASAPRLDPCGRSTYLLHSRRRVGRALLASGAAVAIVRRHSGAGSRRGT
jgi:hypothetical protein